MSRRSFRVPALLPALSIILFLGALSIGGAESSSSDTSLLPNRGAPPMDDPMFPLARRYAPFIYHATDRAGGRQDIISNIDFDGDLIGRNNWENFDRYRLKPTVYYAVLETETHLFISYHLFHPRDWNHLTFYLHDTHENDGENLQVVVRKRDGRVVLLWTQAHYRSKVYTNPGSSIGPGRTAIRAGIQLVDSTGLPSDYGAHAAVFVEAQGHGIYGTLDPCSGVTLRDDGTYAFKGGSGLLFAPAGEGEDVREPPTWTEGRVLYQLDSTTKKLWPLLRDGELTGDGRLLDGSYEYRDDFVFVREVPRYYDADRFSGPFGPDRGISPFALDFFFRRGTLGALFFNPAKRYPERLTIADKWSLVYLGYPFAAEGEETVGERWGGEAASPDAEAR